MSILIPLNKQKNKFEAILEIKDEFYRFHIEKSDNLTRFSCDWKLHVKLKKYRDFLEKRLCQCSDVTQFFDELKLLVHTFAVHNKPEAWNIQYYDVIINNLQNLGWEKIHDISEDFCKIQLKAYDAKDREHFLGVSLNFEYPTSPPLISAMVPVQFDLLWTSDSDLSVLYKQFKVHIQQFERFWDEIDELQENTWILEPESPNFSATSFRIAIDKTGSIHIKVDPLNMGIVPECNFVGAEWSLASIRENFHNNYDNWNENLSLYQNLKAILEIDFPTKQIKELEDVSLQCGICYSYRLGVSVPDQICNDKRCGQPFHHECLLEWFKSVSGSKQSFNIIFGECPYCTSSMKMNMLRD